ncbi:MAG: acyl-CoA dehydratase activase-related protein [Tannerellaceae bacterium]|jgi:predicted CoA-substrate-specific enzyme activase|nr:acyl-CoA dehydratase activase-related protein [Tannerellaceae bacterium]
MKAGIDVGSTTLKIVIADAATGDIVYKTYCRHQTNIRETLADELRKLAVHFPETKFSLTITGSAGMGLSEQLGIPFVQEVVASVNVVTLVLPSVRTIIDLGGEDAKMVFLSDERRPDIRMNGSCAGGTGAFIDQMADLLNLAPDELDILAESGRSIYPIASRCGVFAKTDVQNLLSRHVPQSDLARSILHAVARQTLASLAKGADPTPLIACIGGPLTFLKSLRRAFTEILQIDESQLILPENSLFFPAWGAALCDGGSILSVSQLLDALAQPVPVPKETLPPLFESSSDYEQWKQTRRRIILPTAPLDDKLQTDCFLGIDSGSTTTKIVVIDSEARLLYTSYGNNDGNPLRKVVEGLRQFYKDASDKGVTVRIISSAATGYGEELIRAALGLHHGLVETMAHLEGAKYVDPNVSFVLDIGGQDMKAISVDNGVITNIEINEACSSGCGSFLQNFASAMHLSPEEFALRACLAPAPSDLGTRCTVFMNSKVKQSLRENAGPDNIAAGLACSVVKNCLFKVLKMSNLKRMGEHIILQGGAFRNDAVYRAFERLSGQTVSTTDRPEMMGAFGAALYARKNVKNQAAADCFSGPESLPDCDAVDTRELRCKGCANQCSVLRFRFAGGRVCHAGNKCEKVFFNAETSPRKGFNGFDLKNRLLFGNRAEAPNPVPGLPVIGIPRVLNMFEDYPFWHALFTACGFRLVLSPESVGTIYRQGTSCVMSDNICFPAKLAQGHIFALADMKVDRIFYPIVPKEEREFDAAVNSYNCPVVSGYPDVIRSSVDPEARWGIPLDKPVVTFDSDESLRQGCYSYFQAFGLNKSTFDHAFRQAIQARNDYQQSLRNEQQGILNQAISNGEWVFVLAGRPYHADPLIHQKAGQILSDMGVHVLTDDVFRQPSSDGFRKLRIVSQWAYPNRVVQAAMEVAKLPAQVQLVQLNSFGCGPDSFFIDETGDILGKAGKNHTVLRIDEMSAGGSMRLRLRSLVESLRALPAQKSKAVTDAYNGYGTAYTRKDKQKTILIPWFADFLSPFIPAVAKLAGYKMENLPKSSKASADVGLQYGNNEVCYPSILILGDMILALKSGQYDPNEVLMAITQTGGQCRATNYLSQIKTGLRNAGYGQVPVVAVTSGKVFQNEQEAFSIPYLRLVDIIIYGLLYADAVQRMYGRVIVRERNKGETQAVFDRYIAKGVEVVMRNRRSELPELLRQAVNDFNRIQVDENEFTRVGIVGEIYVKYNNYGQAHISEWLRERRMEVVTPPILDFLMQYFVNSKVNVMNRLARTNLLARSLSPIFFKFINKRMEEMEKIVRSFRFYEEQESIFVKAALASEVLDLSNQFGEGWMVAAEVAGYARRGINRVVCIQPFGCIANHVVAKGIERRLKQLYPDVSLLFLDIDGGMAEVNLQNRLEFLVSN